MFTSVRYHRDMKILKILASEDIGIFKKLQINDDKRGGGEAPNTNIS